MSEQPLLLNQSETSSQINGHKPSPRKPTRAFKGVWIPSSVWLDDSLSWIEKCLLAEIDSLDNGTGCHASSGYLADMMQSTPASIRVMLSRLRQKGRLQDVHTESGIRRIRVLTVVNGGVNGCLHPPLTGVNTEILDIDTRESTPKSPKGTLAGWIPTEMQKKINGLFGRKDSTVWSDSELRSLKKIHIEADDFQMIEAYYFAQHDPKNDIRRRDVGTFLNNFNGELDRARNFKPKSNKPF